jgi:hypothetical protein
VCGERRLFPLGDLRAHKEACCPPTRNCAL